MKIVEPYPQEPLHESSRKQRMEALLSMWRADPYWQRVEDGRITSAAPDEYALTREEWSAWEVVLRVAEPVPPRTHVRGLEFHATMRELDVEELKARNVVRVIGTRVATRWIRGPVPEAGRLGGHSWALSVRLEALGARAEAAEAVMRRRFREVEGAAGVLFAFGPWRGCAESVVALLARACADPTPTALYRLWQLACVLELDDAFVQQLPTPARKALAGELLAELNAAIEHLDVQTDARLEFFAEGHEDVDLDLTRRTVQLPPSRFTSLVQAEQFLEQQHQEIASNYFEDLAAGYASVADTFPLAEFLKRLPPGRAHLAAIEYLWRWRPELIATYVWHPDLHAEGAFALLQLPQQMQRRDARSLSLVDEWTEVQRLGREQLFLADRSQDWASIIALGVHDEGRTIARKHYETTPFLLRQALYEDAGLWARSTAEPERATVLVDVLCDYFRARAQHSEAAFVFALRLLAPLREHGMADRACTLAAGVVDGYASSLALDIELRAIPNVLPAYGVLLEDLRIALHSEARGAAQWTKWLRPFDAISYVNEARKDERRGLDSRVINPRFDVPRIFRAHAEVLIALASASSEAAPLDVALELYATDRRADLIVDAFSWSTLAQTTAYRRVSMVEPLFVRVGRLFGRNGGDRNRLERLLAERPPAHVLAYVLVGLGEGGPFAAEVQRILREALNALLGDDRGVALGHALELANTLHQAGMGRDAERFARRVVLLAERLQRGHDRPYLDAANAILAGALAQQEMWPEILALNVEADGLVQRLFIDNMRAVALLETKKFSEAESLLGDILRRDPANRLALVNRTALHVRDGEWNRALAAAEEAKAQLPSDEQDGVIINEAVAREKLGDRYGATKVLGFLTARGASRPDVLVMKEELRTGKLGPVHAVLGAASMSSTVQAGATNAQVVSELVAAPDDSGDRVDVAIITALHEEYEAVRARLREPRPVPYSATSPFPNLYSWVLGSIASADGKAVYRVVLAVAGQSGNLRSQHTTTRTIDRWRPRYIVFSGIAGGLARNGLKQGDLVLSQAIWHYEYGKVVEGRYDPRQRDSFQPHMGLLNSALSFEGETQDWRECGCPPPRSPHSPACVPGLIGSGDKVIDDLKPTFVRAVLKARPEIQAIEMEAAGAVFAVARAHDEGNAVGFMMVRGISDMPKPSATPAPGESGSGTEERDAWKRYASAIAANFIARWIASSWWPGPSEERAADSPSPSSSLAP